MKFTVALDSIRSTHNVGSIFRTADCVGVSHIVLGGITPSPIDRFGRPRKDVAKVALGAQETITYEPQANLVEFLLQEKNKGSYIVALEQGVLSVDMFDFTPPKNLQEIILVVGNEVEGVSKEVLELCDVVLEIPQVGLKESLNVSVATGIALYHISKIIGTL